MKSKLLPTLASIIALLGGSSVGLVWYWMGANKIVAQKVKETPPPEKLTARARGWDFWTVEIDNLSKELKEEKARLDGQQEVLDSRAARLAAERRELDKLREDLGRMREDINAKIIEIQTDEAKNLRMLAQTYSTLTPHAAVSIMRELDDATVVKILSLMKPDTIGPIFEDMAQSDPSGTSAKRAAMLSEKLRLIKAQRTAQNP